MGDGVVQVGAGQDALLLELLPVVDGALGLGDNAHHSLKGLHRVLAPGGLAREHHAAGAIVDGVSHVGHLRPGGPGVAHHGVQHLGGGDDRLARLEALADHLLLQDGHPGGGNFHTQVAPGHHNAVGGGQDLVQVVHALLVLDLGDDLYIVPAALVEDGSNSLHIRRPADKGGGDKVEVVLHTEADVRDVLLGEGGQLDMDPGDIDGLVGGQGAAVLHGADDFSVLDAVHPDGHQAVVNENLLAGGQLLVELGVGNGHPALVAHHLLGGQGEGVSRLQGDGFRLKAFDADLRPLGVQNGGHRAAHGVPDAFQHVHPFQVLGVTAVGKIEPGRVHAGADEGADQLLVIHCGAQGTDDFCSSHSDYLLRVSFFIHCGRPYVTGKKPDWIGQIFIKIQLPPEKKWAVPPRKTAFPVCLTENRGFCYTGSNGGADHDERKMGAGTLPALCGTSDWLRLRGARGRFHPGGGTGGHPRPAPGVSSGPAGAAPGGGFGGRSTPGTTRSRWTAAAS